jgi:hypothetical protein
VKVIDSTSYEVVTGVTIPDQPQAESLTLSLDKRSLLIGSEGKNSKVYSMMVPRQANPGHGPTTVPGQANPKHGPQPTAPFTPTDPPDNSAG